MSDGKGQRGRAVREFTARSARRLLAALPSATLLPCHTDATSGALGRSEFVMGSYQELKKANPLFPILIR